MNHRVRIRREAESDIANTYRWYEEQIPGLGLEFLRSFEACQSLIQRYPLGFPRVHKQIRRALLRRFPYGLFYLTHKNSLVLLACFHCHQDPRLISSRF